ncbi:MAG: class I SAM-dependent methyltransferase [Planctomycetota bacterium]
MRWLATLATFWRGWLTERRLSRRDVRFRSTNPDIVRRAYAAMSAMEFEGINGAQHWANHLLIPRALRGWSLGRPWRIVDLGCGTGGSTGILTRHAVPGSTVIGYDMCAGLLDHARSRTYCDRANGIVPSEFVRQSIVTTLHDQQGKPLPASSVDVAHSAGVVGHHLNEDAVRVLAGELRRVLTPGGVAILDAGPRLPAHRLQQAMAASGFEVVSTHRLVPFASRATMVFCLAGAMASRSA